MTTQLMRIVREEEFILQAEPTLKKVFVENEDTARGLKA